MKGKFQIALYETRSIVRHRFLELGETVAAVARASEDVGYWQLHRFVDEGIEMVRGPSVEFYRSLLSINEKVEDFWDDECVYWLERMIYLKTRLE